MDPLAYPRRQPDSVEEQARITRVARPPVLALSVNAGGERVQPRARPRLMVTIGNFVQSR